MAEINMTEEITPEEREILKKEHMKDEINHYHEIRINYLNKQIKQSHVMAAIAGATASASALIAIASLGMGQEYNALQSTGSTIAMAAYTIGNIQRIKEYRSQRTILKNKDKNTSEFDYLKERLEQLKFHIASCANTFTMNLISGLGFLITAITSQVAMSNGEPNQSLRAAIAYTIAFLDLYLAMDNYDEKIKLTEEQTSLESIPTEEGPILTK